MELDAISHHEFWVPPGFAHGFFVLSDIAVFTYKCTSYYAPDDEYSLLWNDPTAAVAWPLGSVAPLLSAKDQHGLDFEHCPKYE